MGKSIVELDDSPTVKLFRAVENVLRSDSTLKGAVPIQNWRTWDGSVTDKQDFDYEQSPCITLAYSEDSDPWFSPDSLNAELVVDVFLEINGTCLDDVANLWWAIVRALYPPNPLALSPTPQIVIFQQLQAAGWLDGMAEFTRPSSVTDVEEGADGRMYAKGKFKMTANQIINP